jgi:hypothetical protein
MIPLRTRSRLCFQVFDCERGVLRVAHVKYCAAGQMTQPGDVTTLRFLFARNRLNECYRDVTPSTESVISKNRHGNAGSQSRATNLFLVI